MVKMKIVEKNFATGNVLLPATRKRSGESKSERSVDDYPEYSSATDDSG